MRFDEYRKHDAVALAALVAKGEVTAGELLEIAIARAEQVNPAINAIARTQYPRARAAVEAGLPDGPLRGVPYLIKDLSIFEKDVPAGLGSALYVNFVPDHDSGYTARCKRAGLVIIGRSLTPELGLSPSTEPRQYGACRNPWNLSYSPGGSSGGAAAAVSAGILPRRMLPMAAARSARRPRIVGCLGLSRRAVGSLMRRMPARVGAGWRSPMRSAARCAIRRCFWT